jgi:RNA polymerase sigma-70 factor (ECF subfamily)
MTTCTPTVAETYDTLRPLLFSIAYRMLGSVAEAEDVVQEAFLRYHRLGDEERAAIESPRAYLSAVATRLAIDGLRSARVRRETYVGEWLPEPLLTDTTADVARQAEDADSLSMAFLLVLERLSPVERAVFLLHDVFDYGYDEIARIVGKSEANCRQLAVRARRHVEEHRPRFDASPQERDELAARFFAAVGDGDLDGLVELLAADVEVHGDAGGVSPAWSQAIVGSDRVGRLFAGLGRVALEIGLTVRRAEVNGQPGALVADARGGIVYAMSLEIAGGRIQTIRAVRNPAKLEHLGPVADLRELLRGRSGRGRGA